MVFDQAFELEAESNRAIEGVTDNPLPAVFIMEWIEIIGGVSSHVDVDWLETQHILEYRHAGIPLVKVVSGSIIVTG